MKRICIIGLGYVGLPLACEFARHGYEVLGIEIDEEKVRKINKGESTIRGNEPGLVELLHDALQSKGFRATSDFSVCRGAYAVIICTQTPISMRTKRPDYRALRSAVEMAGRNLSRGTLVVVESTIMPGTMQRVVNPLLERVSGLKEGVDFHLVHVPERVTPGKLIYNLERMPRVIGCRSSKGGEMALELYKTFVKGDIDITDWTTAETVKTVENAYRDVQIALSNEVALICETLGIDFLRLRDLVNRVPERSLHLAGPGVGGACLPKDPWLVISAVKERYTPELIMTARKINDSMPGHVVNLVKREVKSLGIRRPVIAILGYAYKEESDDTRNTPAEPIRKELSRLGEVRVHDPYVEMEFIERDLEKVLRGADILLVVTHHNVYRGITGEKLRGLMRNHVIITARPVPEEKDFPGFRYVRLGYGKDSARAPRPEKD